MYIDISKSAKKGGRGRETEREGGREGGRERGRDVVGGQGACVFPVAIILDTCMHAQSYTCALFILS